MACFIKVKDILYQNPKFYIEKKMSMSPNASPKEEVLELLRDPREAGCDFLTIGQYLQPRPDRLSVKRFVLLRSLRSIKELEKKWVLKLLPLVPLFEVPSTPPRCLIQNNYN